MYRRHKVDFWIFILELTFERTQQPRDLSCCRLQHIDAKSRPHHRAKHGRGGIGISGVMTLTVSRIWILLEFTNSPRTQQPLNLPTRLLQGHAHQIVPTDLPHHCAKYDRVGSSISEVTALRASVIAK